MRRVYGLEDRLTEIVRDFFQSKLGIRPQGIEALQRGNLIMLRVWGFLTKAEAVVVEDPKHRQVLTTYYDRILENLFPVLRVVIQDICKRPLVERHATVDLFRDECVYLLTLGEQPAVAEGQQ